MARLKKQYEPIAYSLVLIIGILLGNFLNNSKKLSPFEMHQNTKIHNILQLINDSYVDSIDQQKLEESAIKSILKEFEIEGGTSKIHSPKSQGFFNKIKEVWQDFT